MGTLDSTLEGIKMYKVTEKVRQLTTGEYDINVWADNDNEVDASWIVNLTFYPLAFPGDSNYPKRETHGFPVVDTSTFYTLKLPVLHRGNRIGEALRYLDYLVTGSSDDYDQFDLRYMDWWSSETVLDNPPDFIAEFVATLPRREN
jgi:hypothetical protein